MSGNPICPSCGGPLRWGGAQWMCDRCRVTFPPAQQQQPYYPQPAQVASPPRSNKKIFIIVGVVALLGGLAVVLALTLGGGGGGSGASSPEAVAKGVIGALNDRDGAAYTRLFAPQEMGDKVIDCTFDEKDKEEAEKRKAEAKKNWDKGKRIIEKAVGNTKATFEFVAMEPKDPPQEKKAGEKLNEQCTVKATHALQSFEMAVKQDGDKTEKRIDMVRIGDTWYLAGPVLIDDDTMRAASEEIEKQVDEEAEGGSNDGKDAQLKAFRAYVDEACACKDTACLNETGKRFSEKAKDFPEKKGPPNEAERALMERVSTCTADLMRKEMGGQGTGSGDGTGIFGKLGGSGDSDPVPEFRRLADEMCACTDASCVAQVKGRLDEFGTKYADYKPRDDQVKELSELGNRVVQCMMRAGSD